MDRPVPERLRRSFLAAEPLSCTIHRSPATGRGMGQRGTQGGATAKAAAPDGIPEEIREFGHYTLLRELGRGAQGVVYLAEDTQLRRKVAVKMLLGSAGQSRAVRERFQREAEVASKLDHPGICGIHEVGEVKDVPYF